jgi:glutamate 5-kinase
LLPAGITQVIGDFSESEVVQLCNSVGLELAIGLVNYSSAELQKIGGQQSNQIEQILGYISEETVVHRDNLVLTGR